MLNDAALLLEGQGAWHWRVHGLPELSIGICIEEDAPCIQELESVPWSWIMGSRDGDATDGIRVFCQ